MSARKNNLHILIKIGMLLVIAGVVMFLFGVSLFTYRGPRLNPLVSFIGEGSFLLWAPVLFLGIALSIIGLLLTFFGRVRR